MAVSCSVFAGAGNFTGVHVEDEVAHHQFGGVHGGHAGTLDQPVQAQQHFLHAEGLGDVVVPAGREADDTVLDVILGRQEERRHLRRKGADPAEQLNAVEPWQHHVQHQDVGAEVLGEFHGRRDRPRRRQRTSLPSAGPCS